MRSCYIIRTGDCSTGVSAGNCCDCTLDNLYTLQLCFYYVSTVVVAVDCSQSRPCIRESPPSGYICEVRSAPDEIIENVRYITESGTHGTRVCHLHVIRDRRVQGISAPTILTIPIDCIISMNSVAYGQLALAILAVQTVQYNLHILF